MKVIFEFSLILNNPFINFSGEEFYEVSCSKGGVTYRELFTSEFSQFWVIFIILYQAREISRSSSMKSTFIFKQAIRPCKPKSFLLGCLRPRHSILPGGWIWSSFSIGLN